jgi:hypothetical protein
MSETESPTSFYQCSPALNKKPGQTCLSKGGMQKIAKVWNQIHPQDPIKLHSSLNKTRKRSRMAKDESSTGIADVQDDSFNRQLWKQLREKMVKYYKCDTEYCLVKKLPGISQTERKGMLAAFRPEKPEEWNKKPTTWLDSFNIEDVMNQYEERKDLRFEFIGPVPIDFDSKYGAFGKCIVDELCKLNLQKQKERGIEHIGIIFNLDPHDKPGSHWVCAFIDIADSAAYYFDSYGYPPPSEVDELLKRCKKQGIQHVYYNDIRHQRKGSECGMYCLFVIICLLNGKSFYSICSNIVKDDTVNSFRDILFSTEKPRADAIQSALPSLCI